MSKEDQRMIKSKKWNRDIIKHNTGQLKHIVIKYGWPHSKLAGMAGESAAWLIAQHSDYDVSFQERCLNLLKILPATKKRKVFVAYLTDRVLVNKKRKQIYGTQFSNGKPREIKNLKNLNNLRQKMYLEPFESYKKRMLRARI